MHKEEYTKLLNIKEELFKKTLQDKNRLGFHLMPPTGWLNDPNGLCEFNGVHHIYFQYTPYDPNWGMKFWGHYTTKDYLSFKEEEPFLFPDIEEDKDGVYSGSSFIEEDTIHYFYTGNVKMTDQDYDYILSGRQQNTIHVTSKDGWNTSSKSVVLKNEDYPSDMSCHVRDPKIYKKEGIYYMVIGARSIKDKGCVLIYQSTDLNHWQYHMTITSDKEYGYMWECPDLFDLNGKTYLVCCPQGMDQVGYDYANVYQFGYFEIELDLKNKTYLLHPFIELDKGFDIYAPQSYEDSKGRRIFIAWMGIPDAPYHNTETIKYGWQHALTMPRVLEVKENHIYQHPLEEMKALRKTKHSFKQIDSITCLPHLFEIDVIFDTCQTLEWVFYETIKLTYTNHVFTLEMMNNEDGRDKRHVVLSHLETLSLYMDTSAIEIFINDGQHTLTSRYYAKNREGIRGHGDYQMKMNLYELKSYHIDYLENK